MMVSWGGVRVRPARRRLLARGGHCRVTLAAKMVSQSWRSCLTSHDHLQRFSARKDRVVVAVITAVAYGIDTTGA